MDQSDPPVILSVPSLQIATGSTFTVVCITFTNGSLYFNVLWYNEAIPIIIVFT